MLGRLRKARHQKRQVGEGRQQLRQERHQKEVALLTLTAVKQRCYSSVELLVGFLKGPGLHFQPGLLLCLLFQPLLQPVGHWLHSSQPVEPEDLFFLFFVEQLAFPWLPAAQVLPGIPISHLLDTDATFCLKNPVFHNPINLRCVPYLPIDQPGSRKLCGV